MLYIVTNESVTEWELGQPFPVNRITGDLVNLQADGLELEWLKWAIREAQEPKR